MFLNIAKMTERQYEQVFVKKSNDEQSIIFRETCNNYIPKCERLFNEIAPFDKKRFRESFYAKDSNIELPPSLLLKDLIDYFKTNNEDIKLRTKIHFKNTMNVMETYMPGIKVTDITSTFLKQFERKKISEGISIATVASHFRNLRRIINYFTNEVKLIPKGYEYPFGKGGYVISSYFPSKLVLKEKEIKSIVEFNDFENKKQEYARDIWLFLYRCNGINFADLLRMKWENKKGDYFIFTRRKTETTRKNNIRMIQVPINTKLQEVMEKLENKDSPFILGQMQEQYSETTYENKKHKMQQEINKNLKVISQKLNLSVPLKMSSARDCYATTLKRNGVSKDKIGEMLGHSNSIVMEHYLGCMDQEDTIEINSGIL
jgi:site-specific recombinase XerD